MIWTAHDFLTSRRSAVRSGDRPPSKVPRNNLIVFRPNQWLAIWKTVYLILAESPPLGADWARTRRPSDCFDTWRPALKGILLKV